MSELDTFKQRLQNLLVEFGIEPFCVIGFRDQEDFYLTHVRGDRDLRSLNDLFEDTYAANHEEEEVEFVIDDEDGEFWKDTD